MINDYYRTVNTDDSTATGGNIGPTNYTDIVMPTGYSNYINTVAKYKRIADISDEIYEEILKNPGLLYKNWLTIDQWIRELYLASVYHKLKKFAGYQKITVRLRTIKATSPIRRNKWGGRK